jgi:hypothetical protein
MQTTRIVLGAVRRPLTAKQGNKNYYKGNRSGLMGRWTTRGHFIPQQHKKREFMISTGELTPYVTPKVDSESFNCTPSKFFENTTLDPKLVENCLAQLAPK